MTAPKRNSGSAVASIQSHRSETTEFGGFMNAAAAKKPDLA
jgi:hypothetical protein